MHVREWIRATRFGARLALGTALITLAVGVAACGSSSSTSSISASANNSSGGGSSTTSGSGSSTSSGAGSSSSAGGTAAQLAALTQRPTHIAVTVPVGKPIPTGKMVVLIPPPLGNFAPSTQILAQAAKALNWTSKVILPTSNDVSSYSNAIDEALREKASAILLLSMPGAALTAPIGRAKAAGVPVININGSEQPGSVPGIVADPLGLSYTIGTAEKTGELLGLLVPPHSTVGEAALLVITRAGVLQQATARGVKTTCPTCKYVANITTAANYQQYVPNIVSFVRANNLKGMYLMNGPLGAGLGPAMRAAGEDPSSLKALAGTIDGADGSAQRVQQSQAPLAAGYVWPSAEGIWYGVDAAARALAGVSTAPDDNPQAPFLVLPGKVPSDVLHSPEPATVLDYQAQFLKLWGK